MSDPLDRSRYAQGAAKYVAESTLKQFPVIEKDTPQWNAWVEYWNRVGAKSTLLLISTRHTWTVPTEYPWQFDGGYAGAPR